MIKKIKSQAVVDRLLSGLKFSFTLELLGQVSQTLHVRCLSDGERHVQDPLHHHAAVLAVHQPDHLAPVTILTMRQCDHWS